jgi:hypothetical protein
MNDDDLKELLDAARTRGNDLAPEVASNDLGWVKGIRDSDVAVIDFIKKCGGIHKKESTDFIPGMAPTDLRSYFEQDVKNRFCDTYKVDELYRVVRQQYVGAFLDGVRFS